MYKKAAKSISIVGAGVLLAKIIGMLSLYYVGKYLTDEQIGEYAAVIGLLGVLTACQNGGIEPLIVQRASHRLNKATKYLAYSLKVNLIVGAVSIASAFVVFRNEPSNIFISTLLTINLLASPGYLFIRTKYLECGNFKKLAGAEIISSVSQYGALILFLALTGHQISFGLAYIPIALFGFVVISRNINTKIRLKHDLAIFSKSKWLIMSSFLTGAVLNVPYLLLGLLETSSLSGLFYFSNQLVYSLSTLLGKPIQSVVLPILSEGKYSPEEVRYKFSRMVTIFGGLMITACAVCSAYAVDPLVKLVWGEKWSGAVPIISVSLIALAIRINNVFFWAYSQFVGDWTIRARLLFGELVTLSAVISTLCILSNNIELISKGIYIALMMTASLNQLYLSIKYSLKTNILTFFQVIAIYGVCFA